MDFKNSVFLIQPPELSGKYQQRHGGREARRNLAKKSVNFVGEVSLSYSAGIFNMS
jgi:hypothetical protein